MGKPGPTDVLAFPIDAAEAEIVQHGQPPSRGPDRAPPDPADMVRRTSGTGGLADVAA